MKKVLLSSFLIGLFLFSTLCAFAYETIIIKFPNKELWVKGYYKKVGNEALLQYVPGGQSSNNWSKTVVIHSYKHSNYPINVFLSPKILLKPIIKAIVKTNVIVCFLIFSLLITFSYFINTSPFIIYIYIIHYIKIL